GVPRDPVIAYAWYEIAAARGNAKARANRDQLIRNLELDQLREGQQLAEEYAQRYRTPLP
ncbi:MAG: sel1 repeat family protein, partial [Candidatus Competibacteraceae bacterium]|nr:sel1 repeat family protein [Candidatus Competibacteraceae bacterium]